MYDVFVCLYLCGVCVCRESEGMELLLSDPRVSLLTNGTLELTNASREDAGTYTCSLTHTNISITAHLEVLSESHTFT